MESVESLHSRIQAAELRADSAERRLEVAKKELLRISTDTTGEQLARAQTTINTLESEIAQREAQSQILIDKVASLSSEIQKFRTGYLSGELDNSLLRDRVAEMEQQLSDAIKPLTADDERIVLERSLSWMALQDPLTRLSNSNALDLALSKRINAARDNTLVVLMIFDLDLMRQVNETAGWRTGDILLREIGQRLKSLVANSATFICRRGEDEFAVLVSLDSTPSLDSPLVRVRQLADMILGIFREPFTSGAHLFAASASMGISLFPVDADSATELLENAHSALTSAKVSARGSYLIFQDRLYLEKEKQAVLCSELADTIANQRLHRTYRPLVSASRGSVAAALVEVAWDHSEHGRIKMEQLVPYIERGGLVHDFTMQTLEFGLALSRKLKGAIPVIVGVVASAVTRPNLIKEILDAIHRSRTRPEALIIDLPASAFERFPAQSSALFSELTRWRIGRSVSDIGSSNIPLTELHRLRPDKTSLSPALTDRIGQGDGPAELTKVVLSLLKNMDLNCRAEGVTHQIQAQYLSLHSCDLLSGDFVAPSADLENFVAKKRAWKFL